MTDPKSGRLRTDKDRRQFGYEQPGAGQDSTGGMAMIILAFLIAGTVLMVVLLSTVSANAGTDAGSDRLSVAEEPTLAEAATRRTLSSRDPGGINGSYALRHSRNLPVLFRPRAVSRQRAPISVIAGPGARS